MEEEIMLNSSKDEIRKVVCSRCDTQTNHVVLVSVKYNWGNEEIQGVSEYEVIRCSGCDSISFRTESSNSEDFDYYESGEWGPVIEEEVYPSRLMGRTILEKTYWLPEKVRSIYKETHAALCTKLKILAGVGIRALVDAICLTESAVGDNLEKKINDLVVKEFLTKKSAEILHQTRLLGNRSAHEAFAASDSQLDVAFDIVENLLEAVYIIPKKAEGLKSMIVKKNIIN